MAAIEVDSDDWHARQGEAGAHRVAEMERVREQARTLGWSDDEIEWLPTAMENEECDGPVRLVGKPRLTITLVARWGCTFSNGESIAFTPHYSSTNRCLTTVAKVRDSWAQIRDLARIDVADDYEPHRGADAFGSLMSLWSQDALPQLFAPLFFDFMHDAANHTTEPAQNKRLAEFMAQVRELYHEWRADSHNEVSP